MKQLLDRVDEQTLRTVLSEEFPHLTFQGAIQLAERLDKWMVTLGDAYVMRVPMTMAYAEAIARERHMLLRLSGRVSLQIPYPLHNGSRYVLDLYWRILGGSLTQNAWDALPIDQQEASADRIACFRRAASHVDARRRGTYETRCHHVATISSIHPGATLTAPHGDRDHSVCSRCLGSDGEAGDPLQTLWSCCIMIWPSTTSCLESQQQLVYGVVDFSDMALGDVHQEFQYMDSFRPWNAERIIHLYEALSGRVLSRERIKLYSAWTALGHAAFATEAPAARALASKHQWVERVAKQGGVGMS